MGPDHLHGSLASRRGAGLFQLRAVSVFGQGSGRAGVRTVILPPWLGCTLSGSDLGSAGSAQSLLNSKLLLEMLLTPGGSQGAGKGGHQSQAAA